RYKPPIEHDEARQVLALAAETVGHPRANTGPALLARAAVQEIVAVGVLREARCYRTDDRQLIDVLGNVRKEIADGNATLAVLLERPRRFDDLADVVELRRRDFHLDGFAVLAVEARLGIERIHLRRPAIHVQEDDTGCPGGMMRPRL